MISSSDIQYPRLKGEKKFQSFCLKLIRRVWNDDYAQEHGRRGQGQHGADITGSDNRKNLSNAAMQCKGSETNDPRQLTEKEIIDEVEKAKLFKPKLDLLIIAYCGDRDQKLQKCAIDLNGKNHRAGLFKVVLWAWDDIIEQAMPYTEVLRELHIENNLTTAELAPRRPTLGSAAIVERLENDLSILKASLLNDTTLTDAVDPIADAKIDVWRDQIVAGEGKAVVNPLRAFIAGLGDTKPHVRFRAFANLGHALAQCGLHDQADAAFEQAAEAEPGTAASHAFLARVALARGHTDRSISEAEKALALDPKQKLAAVVLIEAAPPELSAESFELRFAEIIDQPDVGAAIARRYAESENPEDAIRVARQIPTGTAGSFDRDITIAQAVLRRFEHDFSARVGAPIAEDDLSLIKEARDLLKKSWKSANSRSDRKNWTFIAANLGSAYRLLGAYEDSDAVVLEAYDLSPDNSQIAQRAAIAYLHRGETQRAVAVADSIAEASTGDLLFAANIAASAKDWQKTEKWSKEAYSAIGDAKEKASAAELRVLAAYHITGGENALVLADGLRSSLQPNIAFEVRAAELARRIGDTQKLSEARQRLEAFELQELNALDRVELANAYADDENWAKTARLLEGLHPLDRPSELLKTRLYALYRADLRLEGRQLYESLGSSALESKEILGLGAAIYERSGLLPNALSQLDKAIALDSSDLRSRLDWARLHIRHGHEQRVSRWFRRAPTDFDGEPEDLLEFAQLLDQYGKRVEALKLGYQTVLRHWGSSERLHTMFMSLFLMHPRSEAFLTPSVVKDDCVVYLEDAHGAKARYVIDAEAPPSAEVLSPNHAFAQQLKGAKAGDAITLKSSLGQGSTWKILEIKHKFVDLFHKVLSSHETTFPGTRSFGSFHINSEDKDSFEPIFEQARLRSKLVDDVVSIYEKNMVPIDAVAKVIGTDPIDACLGLRYRSNIVLDTCIGTHDERHEAVSQITAADAIIVDPITLAIWQEIGLLPIIEKLATPRVEIVQATLDEFAARAHDARQSVHDQGGSLEAHGSDVHFVQHSKEQRKQHAVSTGELVQWCRDHATVVPTYGLNQDAKQLIEVLSRASYDTLGTAVEGNKAALIEDRRLRALGQACGLRASSWTQPYLLVLKEKEAITHNQYTKLIAKLHSSRIGFVTVSATDLFVSSGGEAGETHNTLLDALDRTTIDRQSLLNVLVEYTTMIWIAPDFIRDRARLASLVLERLVSRPNGIKLFKAVATLTYERLKSIDRPLHIRARSWSDHIEGFVRGRFIAAALVEP